MENSFFRPSMHLEACVSVHVRPYFFSQFLFALKLTPHLQFCLYGLEIFCVERNDPIEEKSIKQIQLNFASRYYKIMIFVKCSRKKVILVLFLTPRGVAVPFANNPILSDRSIQIFRYQNPSNNSNLRDINRMISIKNIDYKTYLH